MKVLLPGLSQAVIVRQPGRRRSQSPKPYLQGLFIWDSGPDETLYIEGFLKSGVFRRWFFCAGRGEAANDDTWRRVASLEGSQPLGGWCFNSEVVPTLFDVTEP